MDITATRLDIGRQDARLRLLVVTAGGFTKHTLPLAGEVVVGRALGADIIIPSHSVSRRHLRFRVGQDITVEDLGSVNGSRYRNQPLVPGEQVRIAVGDAIELPSVTLVVQQEVERGPVPVVSKPADAAGAPGLVIQDPGMRKLYALVDDIAPSPISVLVLGETGVGKEILAEEIHRRSPRAEKPLLRLNCAALPEQLLESELFGHEKGAFTGAVQAKPGLIESADGGTVFLDEVGELPLAIQAKLLRVIEIQRVLRVGGLREKQVDVRFVSATNRDLEAEVARGTFRADLLYRLNGVTLEVPPLRQRKSELEALVKLFGERASARLQRPTSPVISPAAREALLAYDWPGNIRELRNVMERAVLLAKQGVVELDHLPTDKWHVRGLTTAPAAPAPEPRSTPAPSADPGAPPPTTAAPVIPEEPRTGPLPSAGALSPDREEERQRIVLALEQAAGNQSRAAKLLNMSRRTLINRLEEFNLPRPRKGHESD